LLQQVHNTVNGLLPTALLDALIATVETAALTDLLSSLCSLLESQDSLRSATARREVNFVLAKLIPGVLVALFLRLLRRLWQ